MKITIGGVAQPGTSQESKTGSWRVSAQPHHLHITCTGCNSCALFCPEGCIYGNGRNTYFADLDYCKGCGVCANVCPVHDIVMVPEAKTLPQDWIEVEENQAVQSTKKV